MGSREQAWRVLLVSPCLHLPVLLRRPPTGFGRVGHEVALRHRGNLPVGVEAQDRLNLDREVDADLMARTGAAVLGDNDLDPAPVRAPVTPDLVFRGRVTTICTYCCCCI